LEDVGCDEDTLWRKTRLLNIAALCLTRTDLTVACVITIIMRHLKLESDVTLAEEPRSIRYFATDRKGNFFRRDE